MSGEVVAGEGRMADESRHSAGLLLDTPSTGSGIWLRGNGHNQYDYHVFWMKTDDNTGNEAIATINVIDHTTGTLIGTRPVLKSQFMDTINYQGFAIFRPAPASNRRVRYQVEWMDNGNLWIDKVRANDVSSLSLFRGGLSEDIEDDLEDYYGDTVDPPWRFYLFDEPKWGELDESLAYVDELIEEEHGRKGVTAFHQGTDISPNAPQGLMRHYLETVQPEEFLVDFYRFGYIGDPPSKTGSSAPDRRPIISTRRALNNYKDILGSARSEAIRADIPLWACVQAHNWPPLGMPANDRGNLRDVSPAEIRGQVNVSLAHGATGSTTSWSPLTETTTRP